MSCSELVCTVIKNFLVDSNTREFVQHDMLLCVLPMISQSHDFDWLKNLNQFRLNQKCFDG